MLASLRLSCRFMATKVSRRLPGRKPTFGSFYKPTSYFKNDEYEHDYLPRDPTYPFSAEFAHQSLISDSERARILYINKPSTQNALDLTLCSDLNALLTKWNYSRRIPAVIVRGISNDFSSGTDFVSLYNNKKANNGQSEVQLRNLFTLSNSLAHFTKPTFLVLHGNTIGSAASLALNAQFSVTTETALFSLPETALGFVPHGGATYYLSRLPDQMGVFLALTGHRLRGNNLHKAQVATHGSYLSFIPILQRSLMDEHTDDYSRLLCVLDSVAADPEPFVLTPHRQLIAKCFAGNSIEEIFQALKIDGSEFALQTLNKLQSRSPTALQVTLKLLRSAANATYADTLQAEFAACMRLLDHPDFVSGVETRILAANSASGAFVQTQTPVWHPPTISDLVPSDIQGILLPLPSNSKLQLNTIEESGIPKTRQKRLEILKFSHESQSPVSHLSHITRTVMGPRLPVPGQLYDEINGEGYWQPSNTTNPLDQNDELELQELVDSEKMEEEQERNRLALKEDREVNYREQLESVHRTYTNDLGLNYIHDQLNPYKNMPDFESFDVNPIESLHEQQQEELLESQKKSKKSKKSDIQVTFSRSSYPQITRFYNSDLVDRVLSDLLQRRQHALSGKVQQQLTNEDEKKEQSSPATASDLLRLFASPDKKPSELDALEGADYRVTEQHLLTIFDSDFDSLIKAEDFLKDRFFVAMDQFDEDDNESHYENMCKYGTTDSELRVYCNPNSLLTLNDLY